MPRKYPQAPGGRSKRLRPEPTDENGKLVGSQTSFAARKRRRAGMSMQELGFYNDPENDNENEEVDHSLTFGDDSIIHYSWGKAVHEPIVANKRKRNFRSAFDRRTGSFNLTKDKTSEPVEPNGPHRSHFLRLPLEVREQIYTYVLIHNKAIFLNYDWHRVERSCPEDLSILLKVCRQINSEATSFLYKKNCFQALIRKSPARKSADTHINTEKYLPLIKNAVIDTCSTKNWGPSYLEKTFQCLEILVKANPRLDSLTLVVEPKQLFTTTNAAGELHSKFITFSGFLSTKLRHSVTKLLPRLNCRAFNIIMRKSGIATETGKPMVERLLISLDMSALEFRNMKPDSQESEDFLDRTKQRVDVVRKELVGLQSRFEEVFMDHEKAALEGKCRILGPQESVKDGLGLVRKARAPTVESYEEATVPSQTSTPNSTPHSTSDSTPAAISIPEITVTPVVKKGSPMVIYFD